MRYPLARPRSAHPSRSELFVRRLSSWLVLSTTLTLGTVLTVGLTEKAEAAAKSWNIVNDGLWDTGANWTPSAEPSNTDDVTFTVGAATTITLTAGELANSLTFADTGYVLTGGDLTLTAGTISVGDGFTTTINSAIKGATLTFNGGGTGTLVLGGTNLYTGLTTVGGGTLKLANAAALGTTAAGTTVSTGGTLDLSGQIVGAEALTLNGTGVGGLGALINSDTVNAASLSGTVALGATAVTIGGAGQITLSGVVSGTTVLTKSGAGTLRLTNTANTFTGDIVLSGGVLESAGLLSMGKTVNTSTYKKMSISNNAIFRLTATFNDNTPATTTTTGLVFDIGSGGGTFDVSGAATLFTIDDGAGAGVASANAQLQGSGTLTKIGAGTLSLGNGTSNFNTFTGQIFINEGTVLIGSGTFQLGDALAGTTVASGAVMSINGQSIGNENLTLNGSGIAGAGALINNNGTTTSTTGGTVTLASDTTLGGSANITLNGVVGGPGGLTKIGAGTVTLANTANTYTGKTVITNGTVVINSVAPLGSVSSLGAPVNATDGRIAIGSGATAGILKYTGLLGSSSDRGIDLAGTTFGATLDASGTNGSTGFVLTGGATASGVGSKTLTLTGTNTDANTLGGAIVDNNTGGGFLTTVSKTGAGFWMLDGVSTYSGGTSITAGTLGFATGSSLGTGPITINGGTLQWKAGNTADITGLGITIGTTGGTLDLKGNSVPMAGSITGNGSLAINNGRAAVTGTINLNATSSNVLTVGGVGGTNSVLEIGVGANVSAGMQRVGNAANAAGALNITGGVLNTLTPESTPDATQSFGVANDSYGALNMSGGTWNTVRFMVGGVSGSTGNGAVGVALVSGGTINTTGYIILSRNAASTGVLTLTGTATVNHTGASQNLNLGWQGSGRAELNMAGAGALLDNSGRSVVYGGGTWTGTGIVNLNAGVLKTDSVTRSSGTNSVMNFNGGTLRANIDSANFLGTGISYILNGAFGTFNGGAVIDTNTRNITISSQLQAPTDSGVTSLSLTNGGSGYIGAPAVQIGGDGFGATGYAIVDTVVGSPTYGQVTGIVITNPGVGYTTTTVTLVGGGGTGAAATGAISANTGGGLTKVGNGTLFLTSTANNYTGATTVKGGTLSIASITNGGVAGVIGAATNAASNLVVDGGTLLYTGAATTTDRLFSVGAAGGTVDSSAAGPITFGNTGALGFIGSGARTLTLTGNTVGINVLSASIADGPGGATSIVKNGTTTWQLDGPLTYTGTTTLNAGALVLGANAGLAASSLVFNGGILGLSGPGSLTGQVVVGPTGLITIDTNTDPSALIDPASTGVVALNFPNSTLTGVNGSSAFLGAVGARVFSGSSLAPGAGSTYRLGGGTYWGNIAAGTAGGSGGYLQITGSALTGANNVIIGSDTAIGGASTVQFSGTSNNYTGTTTLDNGTLIFTALNQLGSPTTPAGSLIFDGGILQYGPSNTADVSGRVTIKSGAVIDTGANNVTFATAFGNTPTFTGGLTKLGTGTLTLTSTAATAYSYTGPTAVKAGTLKLDYNASGALTTNLVSSSSQLVLGGGTLNPNGKGGTTANSQTFNDTLIGSGASTLTPTIQAATSGGGGLTINLGNLSRNNGGTVNFNAAAAGNVTLANTILGLSNGTAGALLTDTNGVAYATWGLNDWAARDSAVAKIVSAAVANGGATIYTASTASALSGNANMVTATTLASSAAISSLRFNDSTARVLTLNTGVTLTTGGILIGSGNATGTSITGAGTLTGVKDGDLVVIHNDGDTFTISSVIANNITNTTGVGTGLTKSGTGLLQLGTATNTFTGQTIINGGTLGLDAAARLGSTSGVTLNGGTISLNGTGGAFTLAKIFTIGLNGGTFRADSTASTTVAMTYGTAGDNLQYLDQGARTITLLTTTDRSNIFNPNIADFGGPTSLVFAGSGNTAIMALAGVNSYTGSTTISRGVLRLANVRALPGGLGGPATTSNNTGGGNVVIAGSTNAAYLELTAASGSFYRSVGTGFDQVQWTGNGGFSAWDANLVVNLGGAGAQMVWGSTAGWVPATSSLQFMQGSVNTRSAGTIDFQNAIDLNGGSRTIDVSDGTQTFDTTLSGAITGGVGSIFNKTGAGVLRLTNTANDIKTMVITGGVIAGDSLAALPSAPQSISLTGNGSVVLLNNADPSLLLARIAPGSSGKLLLDSSATTGAAPSVANLDLSSFTGLGFGAFSSIGSAPAYFAGTINPNSNTYRLASSSLSSSAFAAGSAAVAVQRTNPAVNILVLARTNILGETTTARFANFGSGTYYFTQWNNYSGGTSAAGANGDSTIGIGHDAALGAGLITFTSNNVYLGSINGDHSLSNNITLNANGNFVTAGSIANRGIANAGSMTYRGTIKLTQTTNNFYSEGTRNAIFLGDLSPTTTSIITLANNSSGVTSFLITPVGAVAKNHTSTVASDNNTLIIDGDRSLGAVPGVAATSLTLGSANNNLSLPSLWLLPGSGSVALAATRNIAITSAKNPAIEVNGTDELIIPGIISGAAATVVKSGAGTLTLRGSNTFTNTGNLAIIGGTVKLDYAGLLGAGPILAAVPVQLGGSGAGAGGNLLIAAGVANVSQTLGNLTLQPKQNSLTITSGGGMVTLTLGNTFTRSLGGTVDFAVASGSSILTGVGTASTVLADAGGNAYATFGSDDWAAKNSGNTAIVGASTAGAGATSIYTVNPSATAVTAGSNTDLTTSITGLATSTVINTLRFNTAAANALSVGTTTLTTGGILVGSGMGVANVTIFNGTGGVLLGTSGTVKELVIIQNNTGGDGVNTGLLTINAPINDNGGATALTKAGSGTLVLGGTNNYTGITYFNGGVISISAITVGGTAGQLGKATNANTNLVFNGGTLRFTGTGAGTTDRGATFNTASNIEITNAAANLTLGSGSISLIGAVASPGVLNKTGAGTLTLAGSATNASLSVRVTGGTLNLAKTGGSSGGVDQAEGAALIVENSATARITVIGQNQISDASSVLVKAGGTLDLNGASEGFDGLAGGGTVLSAAAATLTFGTNNDANISTNNIGAALAGVGGTGLNSFSGVISGAISIVKTGAGTQILGGANTNTGDTTINSGVLEMGAANVLASGAGKGNVIIGAQTVGGLYVPGQFDLGGFDQALNGLSGATGYVTNSLALYAPGDTNYTLAADRTNTLTVGNNNATGAQNSFGGIIQDGYTVKPGTTPVGYYGRLAVTKVGSGILTLSGANTATGVLTANAGEIDLNTTGTNAWMGNVVVNPTGTVKLLQSNQIFDSSTVSVAGGTFELNGKTETIAGVSLTGNGSIQDTATGGVLTSTSAFDVQSGTVSAVLGGGVGLNKTTGGIVTLAAINTYTGPTDVIGGTLIVSGSITGAVMVEDTATLGGTGSTGAITAQSGGTVSAGAAPATLGTLSTTGGVSLAGNATFQLEINTGAGTTDRLAAAGALSLSAANDTVLTISDLSPAAYGGAPLVFLTYNGTWNGGLFNFGGNAILDGGSLFVGSNEFTLDYNYNGNSVALLAVVPEANSMVMLLGSLGLACGLQRLRRRRR